MNKLFTSPAARSPRLRIAFASSCSGPWGGSEELWAQTALHLAQAGHAVRAFKTTVPPQHPRLLALRAAGCPVTELSPEASLLKRFANRLRPYCPPQKVSQQILQQRLRGWQPHLVVISQGANYDGLPLAEVCHRLALPYVLLAQAASPTRVPHHLERAQQQQAYQGARHSFFVARHNLELTQLQLGMPLPRAAVVWNPYNVPFKQVVPWPAPAEGVLRLACVARLLLADKGQDVLLQVLAQPKWQARPWHLTLYGAGPDEAAIRGMVHFLGLRHKVSLGGHVADISQMWRTHQALVLPSRCEGLPLALVEAMLAGRPAIATNAGGMAELLTDNETGFLADGLTLAALDEALERAWAARADWPYLGLEAARRARAVVPADAPGAFARQLLAVAYAPPAGSPAPPRPLAAALPEAYAYPAQG